MIIVGYQKINADNSGIEDVIYQEHEAEDDAHEAMQALQTAESSNAEVLQFFYGIRTSEDEYQLMAVVDK